MLLPQFVVDRGHNILYATEKLFTAVGFYISLWPKITIFEMLQDRAGQSASGHTILWLCGTPEPPHITGST